MLRLKEIVGNACTPEFSVPMVHLFWWDPLKLCCMGVRQHTQTRTHRHRRDIRRPSFTFSVLGHELFFGSESITKKWAKWPRM